MAYAAGMDAQLMKEEARIRLKRTQNNARRDRFLNARKRIIGVDVDALDAQVAEKMQCASDVVDEDRLEHIKHMEIDRILEEAKQEEFQMRAYQQAEMKKSWNEAAAQRAALKAAPEPFLDPLLAGPSAAQSFAGSDPSRGDRTRAQKAQMLKWVQEQMQEKAEIKSKADVADESYSQMLKAVEQIRDAADKEEAEMKAYLENSVKEGNQTLIASKRQREINKDADWNALSRAEKAAASSINLRDNEEMAMNEFGRITRRDAFRGYTDAQKRRIIQENEEQLARQRAGANADAESDEVWLKQQQMQMQAMEQAHHAEHQMRESETKLNLEVLKQQIALQQQRRAASKTSRFGTISSGFFDQFGNDCR